MGAARQPTQPCRDRDTHDHCQCDEKPSLPPRRRCQEAEGRSHIVHAGNVEDRQHSGELELAEVLCDVALGELIGEYDGRRQQKPRGSPAPVFHNAHANLRSSPGPSMLTTQRAQSSG